jgi:hypothetical protein
VVLSGDSEESLGKLRKQLAAEQSMRFSFDLAEHNLPPDDGLAVQAVLALLSPVFLPADGHQAV